ncbi:MAG: putative high-affinity branched-chain amino acid transport protein superfamily, atp bind, partial [Aeromicrobium sp.]|nr:putative high-affinity branched-chain amino acid transport protein superfamily, atp bind [Aeromicrobium sp.]
GSVPAVRGISLSVCRGEVVALLGANGAGKTTILRALAGDLALSAGVVRLFGVASDVPLHKRVRAGMRYVTEERSVFMQLTVLENLRLGRGDVEEALDRFPELRPLLRRRAGLLSGGEQQMLTLARALGGSPSVLLLDELSLGLAPLVVERLFVALRHAAEGGLAVVLVEQQLQAALDVATRAYVIRRGQVVLHGSAANLRHRIADIESHYISSVAIDEVDSRLARERLDVRG